MVSESSFNQKAAAILRDCAELLRQQKANPFRVNAYRRAAATIEATETDVRDILEREGTAGLETLPGIGRGLSAAIEVIARTGSLSQLDRLRGEADPEALFATLPGIGPSLARAIHEDLHVDTLEALEVAAHDGRLAKLKGFGPRRAEAVRVGIAAVLGRRTGDSRRGGAVPPVALLLEIDSEYRTRVEADDLPKIAPKRFNPAGKAWLPVLHADRSGWHFTALFSNTARAHELGHTHDWVVIYFYDDDHHEGQCTIVTETHGPLKSRRVVRGREAECQALLLR